MRELTAALIAPLLRVTGYRFDKKLPPGRQRLQGLRVQAPAEHDRREYPGRRVNADIRALARAVIDAKKRNADTWRPVDRADDEEELNLIERQRSLLALVRAEEALAKAVRDEVPA